MYLLFDIGGTKTRIALCQDSLHIDQPTIFETPINFDEAVSLITKHAKDMARGLPILGAAGGIPGVLDSDKSMLLKAPHLQEWVNQPLELELERNLHCSVYLENDAALVGLGETVKGAGQNKKIVAYITVSTGVGGARIVEGQIDTNTFGFEPGHQIINIEQENYSIIKSLEQLVSGSGIFQIYQKTPESIEDQTIWDIIARQLAIGLHNTILHWSPEIVVIGGSVGKRLSLDVINESLRKSLSHILPVPPVVVKASLNEVGGLIGAAQLLKLSGI